LHSLPFCIFSGDSMLLKLHSLPFCIFSGDFHGSQDALPTHSASSLEILRSQSAHPSLKIPRSHNPYPTILHVVWRFHAPGTHTLVWRFHAPGMQTLPFCKPASRRSGGVMACCQGLDRRCKILERKTLDKKSKRGSRNSRCRCIATNRSNM
jgi:hypothetical protein